MQRFVSSTLLAALLCAFIVSCSSRNEQEASVSAMNHPRFSHMLTNDMSDFEKSIILRRLIADTVDAGYTSDILCLNFANISFQDFVVDSFLFRFGNNTGTAKCGLTASILCKTLNEHGIEAYTYNFGFAETRLTHVVVLARTDSEQWTLHDPFFNYTITDTNGYPKDFFLMLNELGQRNHMNISFTSDTVMREMRLENSESLSNFVSSDCITFLKTQLVKEKDSHLVRLPICHSCVFDSIYCPELNIWYNLSHKMKEYALPNNAMYGFLFQINGVWGPNSDSFQQKLDSAFNQMKSYKLIESRLNN